VRTVSNEQRMDLSEISISKSIASETLTYKALRGGRPLEVSN
jgi:hypothetical protein